MSVPLFDLGNVVVKVDWTNFFKYLEKHQAHGALDRFLHSSLFYEFEFGQITASEFVRRMELLYKTKFDSTEFFAAFCDIFPGVVEGMPELLGELAAKTKIYCLSNTNQIHLEFARKHFDFSFFDKIFASHEIHRRKPYPGTYREVAKLLETEPRNIVFFDDLMPNIHGAQKAGLEAHLFTDTASIRDRISSI